VRSFPQTVLMTALVWLATTLAHGSAALTFLHARGQDLVNERGETVLLRGVGLGNWMLPEGYMWRFGPGADRPRRIEKLVSDLLGSGPARRFWTEYRRRYITEADIQRISALGFNSVRPALNSRLFLSETGECTGREEGFVLLDHLVTWCKADGIYVILDMHGAPGGQTGQNIDDSANDQPELFMNPKYQQQLLSLWQMLARRYKDEPAIAGYDLLNEPLPERTGAAKAYKAQLEPLYKRITQAIREVDPHHLIILEGADWANEWSVFTKPFDPNTVYEFHYYCWDRPTVLKSVQRYLEYRSRFNAPIWAGETGEKDNAIYWATTQYFEANNIGWSFWPWKKMDARNAPCSFRPPADWDAVRAYSRGGAKPAPGLARKAFDALLENIRLENCVFYPDVVNAMLRRAPVRVEAENYGPGGLDQDYQVEQPDRLSRFYRLSEPVPVTEKSAGRSQSERYITLKAGEWTAYHVRSQAAEDFELTLRARAMGGPAEAQLSLGGQQKHVVIPPEGWSELKLGSVPLNPGINRVQWLVNRGVVELDWFELQGKNR
jgi:Cellulase (glycosyl hydrolase family 5)